MEIYVEFQTWAEGPINTPWPFVVLGAVDQYRPRGDTSVKIPASRVQSIFMGFDAGVIAEFLQEHVNGIEIGAVIDVPKLDDVDQAIKSIFGHCEILGRLEVNDQNRPTIARIMQHAKDLSP